MGEIGRNGRGGRRLSLQFLCFMVVWPLIAWAGGPLEQEVYVWQRSWGEPVIEAVRQRATHFSMMAVLAAEVTWSGNAPKVARVRTNWEALKRSGAAVGLVLRVGPVGEDAGTANDRAKWLAEMSRSLLDEALRHEVRPRELQIDFDCAESKLEGYIEWVEVIRREISPVPIVITALPAWLPHREFERLARAADGFVLQVHSLKRPTGPDSVFALCDIEAARGAVERAGRLGKSFRVALPTYGYVIAFDAEGKYAGLSAEGPRPDWPAGWQLREVRADPAALAGLVQAWSLERPDALRGVIWYRLPVATDVLNWSWPTLARVMTGEAPAARLRVEARRPQAGLAEFDVVNEGDADFVGTLAVEAEWSGARPLASDGLGGFEPVATGTNRIEFRNARQRTRIPPQERRMIGWLRLAEDAPVASTIRGVHHETAD